MLTDKPEQEGDKCRGICKCYYAGSPFLRSHPEGSCNGEWRTEQERPGRPTLIIHWPNSLWLRAFQRIHWPNSFWLRAMSQQTIVSDCVGCVWWGWVNSVVAGSNPDKPCMHGWGKMVSLGDYWVWGKFHWERNVTQYYSIQDWNQELFSKKKMAPWRQPEDHFDSLILQPIRSYLITSHV